MPSHNYLNAFFNPPAGGNERGVPTVNQMMPQGMDRYAENGGYASEWPIKRGSMSGPGNQGSVFESFDAGAVSADRQNNDSSQVGKPEMRNYRRQTYERADEGNRPGSPATLVDATAFREGDGRVSSNVKTSPPNVSLSRSGNGGYAEPKYQPQFFTNRRPDGRNTGR